jgi:type IV pilus assembly protein PilE
MLGFTLLEVALVCTMLGVLAAYAVPMYSAHLMRGHRAAAKVALYRAAQWLERTRYDGLGTDNGTETLTLPPGFDRVPEHGTVIYWLRILPANATNGGYALQAQPVPTGPMSADRECGVFELDAIGRRANHADALEGPVEIEHCWGT